MKRRNRTSEKGGKEKSERVSDNRKGTEEEGREREMEEEEAKGWEEETKGLPVGGSSLRFAFLLSGPANRRGGCVLA